MMWVMARPSPLFVGADDPPAPPGRAAGALGPMLVLAAAVMVGVVLGRWAPLAWPWLGLGAAAVGVAVVMRCRGRLRGVRCWGLLAVAALAAAWLVLRTHRVAPHDIGRYVLDRSQLAEVTGLVATPPVVHSHKLGAFGRFNWQPPSTVFTMDVSAVVVDGRPTSASGRLLVRVKGKAPGLKAGRRIVARGWLSRIRGPRNPGEFNYRAALARRHISGQLSLAGPGNWRPLPHAPPLWKRPQRFVRRMRRAASRAADRSLALGLAKQPVRLALLRALLLGRWSDDLDQVQRAFRRTGLAHLLSISGAHLGILMGLVWLAARLFVGHPPRAALVVLAVLGLYLTAVPIRVPILRAAIMAGLFCAAYGLGRRVRSIELTALAAVVVLVWRPTDLFTAGFQLSFGIVAALLLFAAPMARRLWPPPEIEISPPGRAEQVGRWLVGYLAASLVAFAAALPLVAFHFQMISPLSVLLSILALPVVTLLLAVGYVKILAGLALSVASVWLGTPLSWLAAALLGLVEQSARLPGAWMALSHPPSFAWTAAALAAVAALLAGWFVRRRAALATTAAVLAVWLIAAQRPGLVARWSGRHSAAAKLNMFAVADGSCFLLRWPGGGSGRHTLMFDCGSGSYWDVGEKSIAPSLRRLGVRRLETLLVSHADLDHYGGVLDVAEALPVERVLVPPQFLKEAAAVPDGAAAYLVAGLRRRGVTLRAVSRGWRRRIDGARLDILWPPSDFVPDRTNDSSLVLSFRAGGRRVLLNGDIQQEAMVRLLEAESDLHADVTDLPHHGSRVEVSLRWLKKVAPRAVLQSAGAARWRRDAWADVFTDASTMRRFVTARDGMVELKIGDSGRLRWSIFVHRKASETSTFRAAHQTE